MHSPLLRFDSLAGLSVGAFTALLAPWLAEWYRLPLALVWGFAAANVGYGLYSGVLSRWPAPRPRAALGLLIAANLGWGLLCFALAAHFARQASALGIAHLLLEGAFVGGLAVVEFRQRARL